MIDFKILSKRFREFGGMRLLLAYYKMGVLEANLKAVWECAKKNKSFKDAYPKKTQQIDQILEIQYRYIVDESKSKGHDPCAYTKIPHIVWSWWLQGSKDMPELVRDSLSSQRDMLPDYEHRLLTLDNFSQWVTLPEYIIKKYAKGIIPAACFSDILRLCVLKKYGGMWMDASVFCSGLRNEKLHERWQKIENSEFTIFRYFQRGNPLPVGLSNWFIAAVPNNVICSTVLDMLLAYWRDYDCVVDYYMFHLFMGLCLDAFPEINAQIPHENSYYSIMLGNKLKNDYNEAWWQDVANHVFIHKLNYRKAKEAAENQQSFYNELFRQRINKH